MLRQVVARGRTLASFVSKRGLSDSGGRTNTPKPNQKLRTREESHVLLFCYSFTLTFFTIHRDAHDESVGSITYSGGQASAGQGGYYGSGGARVSSSLPTHHPEATARQADINALTSIMSEVDTLESELYSLGNVVTSRTIEIKARIKKTISNPRVRELLTRLEIKGEPVWGLSTQERNLVKKSKERYFSS